MVLCHLFPYFGGTSAINKSGKSPVNNSVSEFHPTISVLLSGHVILRLAKITSRLHGDESIKNESYFDNISKQGTVLW